MMVDDHPTRTVESSEFLTIALYKIKILIDRMAPLVANYQAVLLSWGPGKQWCP